MKIPWYCKLVLFSCLMTIMGSGGCDAGGSDPSNTTLGTPVRFNLLYANRSGATAVFSSSSNQTQHVASNDSVTVPATINIAPGSTSAKFTVAVTGGGGEHFTNDTNITKADEGKTVKAIWPASEDGVVFERVP